MGVIKKADNNIPDKRQLFKAFPLKYKLSNQKFLRNSAILSIA